MKQMKIILAALSLIAVNSCGKGLYSDTNASDKGAIGGFVLVSPVFEDGADACAGNAGTTMKFAPFTGLFTTPSPSSIIPGMSISACTHTQRRLIADSDGTSTGSASETTPPAESLDAETNAKKFIALCEEMSGGQGLQTFKAIENALQGQVTNTAKQQPQGPSGNQAELTAESPAPAQPSGYCANLYSAANGAKSLDFSKKNPPISDLRPLAYLTNLRELNLSGNPIYSAAVISNLNLQILEISNIPLADQTTLFRWK